MGVYFIGLIAPNQYKYLYWNIFILCYGSRTCGVFYNDDGNPHLRLGESRLLRFGSLHVHNPSTVPSTHVGHVLDLGNEDIFALFISQLNSLCLSVDPVGFSL